MTTHEQPVCPQSETSEISSSAIPDGVRVRIPYVPSQEEAHRGLLRPQTYEPTDPNHPEKGGTVELPDTQTPFVN